MGCFSLKFDSGFHGVTFGFDEDSPKQAPSLRYHRQQESAMEEAKEKRARLEGSQPILRVEDMNASIRFYVDILGFQNAGWATEEFTSISRDRAAIYLCQR